MASEPIRVLIVEDSVLTAEHLCDSIRQINPVVTCSVVTTQQDALDALSQSPPHIVVLDIRLRVGSGFGVLKSLSKQVPKPLVVVLTNYALPQYRDFALLSGADYFLDKAVNLQELPQVLAPYIEKELATHPLPAIANGQPETAPSTIPID